MRVFKSIICYNIIIDTRNSEENNNKPYVHIYDTYVNPEASETRINNSSLFFCETEENTYFKSSHLGKPECFFLNANSKEMIVVCTLSAKRKKATTQDFRYLLTTLKETATKYKDNMLASLSPLDLDSQLLDKEATMLNTICDEMLQLTTERD